MHRQYGKLNSAHCNSMPAQDVQLVQLSATFAEKSGCYTDLTRLIVTEQLAI